MKKLFASDIEREKERKFIQARIPRDMQVWIKALSVHPRLGFGTQQKMFTYLFKTFLEREPWLHGFDLRNYQAQATVIAATKEKTTFVQVNIELGSTELRGVAVTGPDLAMLIKHKAEDFDVSVATFAYAALSYLTTYMYPVQKHL